MSPIAGAALLSALAASSPLALYLGTALLGLGMASIFATGFLWVEQRITITSKVLIYTNIAYMENLLRVTAKAFKQIVSFGSSSFRTSAHVS